MSRTTIALIASTCFVGSATPASECRAQAPCQVGERIKVLSPYPQADFPPCQDVVVRFGASVAIDHGTAVVGAPNDFSCPVGKTFVLSGTGGPWSISAMLNPLHNDIDDFFGQSVAISEDVIVVGAPGRDDSGYLNAGLVHVFRRQGLTWYLEAELAPDEPAQNRRFGTSVAVFGDTIFVGAPSQNESAVTSVGAAFTFRYTGSGWVQTAKLVPSDGVAMQQFGASVDIDGDVAIIGALPTSASGLPPRGSAYVFHAGNDTWSQEQKLQPLDGVNGDYFGAAVAANSDRVVIGAPGATGGGAAYVYAHVREWTLQQKLPSINQPAEFGTGVDIEGGTIVVSAPRALATWAPSLADFEVGGGAVYRFDGAGWILHHRLRPKYTDPLGGMGMTHHGSAAAMSDGVIILGAKDNHSDYGGVISGGTVSFFDASPPDCNADGALDNCQTDANFNDVPDDCDIASGSSDDCNGDGTPDECEVAAAYSSYTTGTVTSQWGPVGSKDFVWLYQFTVSAGHEFITHIAVPWSSLLRPNLPMKLLIYKDANNDGDPTDGVLVLQAPAEIADDHPPLFPPPQLTVHPVPRTFVGHAGDKFFVGAVVSCPPETTPALAIQYVPHEGRNWYCVAAYGGVNLTNLAANPPHQLPNNLVLRAYSLDCNGNGVPDQCDIESKYSVDANANDIPDECEVPCIADVAPIHGDGSVGIDDLVYVVTSWGQCRGCPPDVNHDGIVDVIDLATVISDWGSCTGAQ